MKDLKILMLFSVIACLTAACTDNFSEINWPNGGLTEEELNRDNNLNGSMVPAMEMMVVPQDDNGSFQHCESLLGDVCGRMLMSNAGGPSSTQKWTGDFSCFRYDGPQWLNNPFSSTLRFYTSYISVLKFTEQDPTNSVYAIARILRVATMHRLADMYGPIPYSKIDPADLDLYIPYDDDDVVYLTMLSELSEAIDDLKDCIDNDRMITIDNFDRIYGGDYTKWLKYANSLMLRLAVRISNVAPVQAKEYAQKAVQGGVIESNAESAFLHMVIGRMTQLTSKLYVMAYNYIDTFAAADLLCYMNGYNDPRRAAYFNQVEIDGEDVYFGLRAGSGMSRTDIESKISRPKVNTDDDYPLLTASEVAFLRAECAYMWPGFEERTAEDFYREGIRLSFEQWKVQGVDTYLECSEGPSRYEDYVGSENASLATDVDVKWEADGNELQRIITQKYIAMYPLGHETWCDYRRTGFPVFLPVFSKVPSEYNGLVVLNRVIFSKEEAKNNTANLNEALTMLSGPDDFATKLWWAK
ncbi:SusD/RagB family nutrient-binding outer membrane lipoprotein [uncultured Bacteroides sp.]|uniref:SusD/RagB family nutrient-binding outer membrane lipoprotein n=1 Tax=uncultured Bacteroides sp. TaxID=162156 RepID=UPI00261BE8E9|nr:SusD/RagB family nutrient-binding outer membrane lipoprotein [uncultured Bacteroides sp.]